MGSDACVQHLKNIIRHLKVFERLPKKIQGNHIFEWFNEGENLFKEFCYLGTSIKWNLSEIRNKETEVSEIVSRISENQGWLQSFITIYPGLRVDLEEVTPAVDVCIVRSGIEFLLKAFTNINENFDKVIRDLENFGELEEFDEHLKVWKEGNRPDFFPGDRLAHTPKSHWWWS